MYLSSNGWRCLRLALPTETSKEAIAKVSGVGKIVQHSMMLLKRGESTLLV